jgi:hypothetical protein
VISAATLIATAHIFWATAAPGVADQNCPDGVRYNVKSVAAMMDQRATVDAEAQKGSCVVTFRAGWRSRITDRTACMLVIHEVGHAALRLEHAKSGIMTDGLLDPKRAPSVCMRFSNR